MDGLSFWRASVLVVPVNLNPWTRSMTASPPDAGRQSWNGLGGSEFTDAPAPTKDRACRKSSPVDRHYLPVE